jgi:uncharacterized protein YceK
MDYKVKIRQSVTLVIPLLLSVLAIGCATVGHIVDNLIEPPMYRDSVVYSGTRYHLHEIPLYSTRARMHLASQIEYAFRWWHYIDLPMCICADTLLLPYTIPRDCYTKWKNIPTAEEKAFRTLVGEWSQCIHNLENLECAKLLYAETHNLAPSATLPQDLDVYRGELRPPVKRELFYVCPSDGTYRIGNLTEEPSCSIHGLLSQAKKTYGFLAKHKRLPETSVDEVEAESQVEPK